MRMGFALTDGGGVKAVDDIFGLLSGFPQQFEIGGGS